MMKRGLPLFALTTMMLGAATTQAGNEPAPAAGAVIKLESKAHLKTLPDAQLLELRDKTRITAGALRHKMADAEKTTQAAVAEASAAEAKALPNITLSGVVLLPGQAVGCAIPALPTAAADELCGKNGPWNEPSAPPTICSSPHILGLGLWDINGLQSDGPTSFVMSVTSKLAAGWTLDHVTFLKLPDYYAKITPSGFVKGATSLSLTESVDGSTSHLFGNCAWIYVKGSHGERSYPIVPLPIHL